METRTTLYSPSPFPTIITPQLLDRVLSVSLSESRRSSSNTVSIYGQELASAEYLALVNSSRSSGFLSTRNVNSALVQPQVVERYRLLSTQPLGFFPNGSALPPRMDAGERSMETMTTLFGNVMALLANSVLPTSQGTYSTGWKRWIIYCAIIGTDRYLQTTPPSYYLYLDNSPGTIQISFPILACAGYMAYLVDHPTQPVAAGPATKYLSAVRYHLVKSGMDISFYEKNPYLKQARAGLMNKWLSISGNSIADHETIPIPIQMLEIAAAETLDMSILNHMAMFIACVFAYTFLCRVSEYLLRRQSKHHILSQSVVFWIRHNYLYEVTPVRPYLLVPSHDAWQFTKDRLLGVNVTIKDGKSDPQGSGFKHPIPRATGIDPNRTELMIFPNYCGISQFGPNH